MKNSLATICCALILQGKPLSRYSIVLESSTPPPLCFCVVPLPSPGRFGLSAFLDYIVTP